MKNKHVLLQSLVQDTKKYLRQEHDSFSSIPLTAKESSFFVKKEPIIHKKPVQVAPQTPPTKSASSYPKKPPVQKSPALETTPPKQEMGKPASPEVLKKEEKKIFEKDPSPVETAPSKEEFFVLQPLEKPHYIQNSEIKRVFQKIAPDVTIVDKIPDDRKALLKKNGWKTKTSHIQVVLLTKQTQKEYASFLENLSKAVQNQFAPSMVFSLENIQNPEEFSILFPAARLVLVTEKELKESSLLSLYKEIPAQGRHLLGSASLIFLSPLSMYGENAENKRTLWKLLCQKVPEILSQKSS